MKQTVDANVDMNISSDMARERQTWAYIIFPREALRVCSFNYDGQCEGLKMWDEQMVRLSRFFINQSNAKEGSPAA